MKEFGAKAEPLKVIARMSLGLVLMATLYLYLEKKAQEVDCDEPAKIEEDLAVCKTSNGITIIQDNGMRTYGAEIVCNEDRITDESDRIKMDKFGASRLEITIVDENGDITGRYYLSGINVYKGETVEPEC